MTMTKTGRTLRLARLFRGQEAPLFLVPLDHTVTDGPFADAAQYDKLLGVLADNGVDAIAVHKGRLGRLHSSVYSKLSVIVHVSASTRYAADPSFKYQVGDAEDCLRRGADAISVHVNMGSITEDLQIRMMAEMADACDRVGLPMLAMIYPRGPGVKDHPPLETLLHAATLAADVGVDLVKLPFSGVPVADMTQVVNSCPIPILAAGGAKVSDKELAGFAADVMKSGARGLAMGRNIFLSVDPASRVREIRKILHSPRQDLLPHTARALAQPHPRLAESVNSKQ
jgi:2-amino-4,5-dihydroxy-6-oxo-7-(phosphonooxy)heptanoate synthase